MSRVVRASKFRHVFGQVAKKEETYQNINVSRNAWDSNYVKANPKYFAVAWEAAGGGSFAVIPYEQTGKLDNLQLCSAHKGAVLDLDFHPFYDNLVASVSEDGNVLLWKIEDKTEKGVKSATATVEQTLMGHKRKVGTANFNPVANNVLATSSSDFTVKLWDVEQGKNIATVTEHSDIIQCLDWKYNGSLAATSCKDKKTRVFDPRTDKIAAEVIAHQGVKGSRVCWMADKLLTIGFSKTSEREFNIYDPRNLEKELSRLSIDTASGMIMPFFDMDNNILYLAGKGDGNIRYYEIVDEAPYFHYLTEFKSNTPQRGLAFIPKRAVNVSECEIARALKLLPSVCEPISFRVPRKSDMFQDDLYPDTYAGEPALTVDQYISGKDAEPIKRSLAPDFVAKPKAAPEFSAVQQKVEEGPKNEKELRDEYEKLKNRVSYLEAEIVKKDAKIRDLESK